MKFTPFTYGLIVMEVYDKGAMYPSAVLDITNETLEKKFMSGVAQVASLSLASGYPTLASVPHSIVNAYKNVLAISIGTDYTFELAQKVKDYLANPGAFASAAPAAGGDAAAGGAAKAAAVEEEEEEAEMDFDLFD
jgi:large subunit ribosomal protein LP0